MHMRVIPMVFMFSIKTVGQGYHIYEEMWNAAMDGTELPCKREIGTDITPMTLLLDCQYLFVFDHIHHLSIC